MGDAKLHGFLNDLKFWMHYEPNMTHGKVKFFIFVLTVKIWVLFAIWFLKFKIKWI